MGDFFLLALDAQFWVFCVFSPSFKILLLYCVIIASLEGKRKHTCVHVCHVWVQDNEQAPDFYGCICEQVCVYVHTPL